MNLITTAYWQTGQNHSALLLQQYQYRHVPICMIALCAGCDEAQGKTGAYLTGRLLQWFRHLSFKRLARNPDGYLSALESSLQALLKQLDTELISCGLISQETLLPLSGILCSDDHFLLFIRGKQNIYLLNKGFGQSRLQFLSGELAVGQPSSNALILRQGILQQDVGLLFGTDTFCDQLTDSEIRECLYVEELQGQDQVCRRLQELGNRAETLGGRDMSAALLLTRNKSDKRAQFENNKVTKR